MRGVPRRRYDSVRRREGVSVAKPAVPPATIAHSQRADDDAGRDVADRPVQPAAVVDVEIEQHQRGERPVQKANGRVPCGDAAIRTGLPSEGVRHLAYFSISLLTGSRVLAS